MSLNERIIKELMNRGFKIRNLEGNLIRAVLNKLLLEVYLAPGSHFPMWFNPLDMIEELRLDDVDALIVVSERPYTISDYILENINKARYWFSRNLNIRVYAVNIDRLEEDIEDAVNLIVTSFHDKVSNVDLTGSHCPSCGSPMKMTYISRFYSVKWRTWINESVEVCEKCKILVHRLSTI